MRIVLMGNGPFAVPTLDHLVASGHPLPLVVVRPERGKPGKTPPSPVRLAAERHGLPVAAPPSVNTPDGQAILADVLPDLLVVCDFGEILSRPTLAIAPLGGINLHGSLLPKYRGAAPVQWSVLSGDEVTGVSVIHMTPRLDGGPILAIRSTPLGPDETAGELETRLADLGVSAVDDALQQLASWDRTTPIGTAQDAAQVSKAPRLSKADGAIDWTRSANALHNHVRGMNPWPRAFTAWHRAGGPPLRLIIESAGSLPADSWPIVPDNAAPGTVVSVDQGRILVATGNGILELRTVQPIGKRPMPSEAFLRGYPVRVGDRLGPDESA